MASLKLCRQRWQTKVRIPKALEGRYEGRKYLYRHFATSDRKAAQREADLWEARLRVEWALKAGDLDAPTSSPRALYNRVRESAVAGAFELYGDPDEDDPVDAGISWEIGAIADAVGERETTEEEDARLAALNDALRIRQRKPLPRRPELEPTFRETASDYLKLWRTQSSLKPSNTENQKTATYWGSKPIRDIRKADAAAFVDALRQMNPLWGRSPHVKAKGLTWSGLQREFGGQPTGLSDSTINRHMATLASLWTWAQERDHCEGNNPFGGFHRKLKDNRNVQGYLAWEKEELRKLFTPPPKRSDVTEIMLVAMYSGMRLDEIASLTRGQIKREGKVDFVQVEDAKTVAGIRPVPIHPQLSWLIGRGEGDAAARIWPNFNTEGPGKKAGADAGKEFSRFKLARGFDSRRKAFHSFRKNFVGQLEGCRVAQSEVAQLVGHEKGFTFGKYGAGISLAQMAKIVALVKYPDLPLPEPS
jgi:integrase